VDDLKLISKTGEELQKQMQIIRTFIDNIGMELGLDKCATIVLKNGKLVYTHNLTLDMNREIQELKQGKMCKYHGVEESEGMRHKQTKERLKKGYIRRLRMILKSNLNAKNKITAIGA
jgi:hypothetical protein